MIKTLEEGQKTLSAMARTAIKINYRDVVLEDGPLRSRVLGLGYWENSLDRQWPQFNGAPMALLLQINWAEVAQVSTPKQRSSLGINIPTQGITQWYMDQEHALYGMDPCDITLQEAWRVIHWDSPQAEKCVGNPEAPQSILPGFPATRPAIMEFDVICQAANLTDVVNRPHESVFSPSVYEQMLDADPLNDESHIGGYPVFLQGDPRTERMGEAGKRFALLLQINHGGPFSWIDEGAAHLFIDPARLPENQFSTVAFSFEGV